MKRVLSLLISVIMIISSMGITALASDYSGHWSETAINSLISDGVVTGDAAGNIRPDDKILRAEFVKVINKYFGYTEKASSNFADVSASKWYADEFLIAKAAGYITGDENGHANPEANITRAEVSVILSRLLGLKENTLVSFTDGSSIPDWAKGHIGAMYAKGLISGYEDGSFKADKNITRAEAFSLVTRVNKNDVKKDAPAKAEEDDDSVGNISFVNGSSVGSSSGSSSSGGSSGGSSSKPQGTAAKATLVTSDSSFDAETSKFVFESRFASKFNVKINVTNDVEGKKSEFIYEDVDAKNLGNNTYEINFVKLFDKVVAERQLNNEEYKVSVMVVAEKGKKDLPYAEVYKGTYSKNLPKPEGLESLTVKEGEVVKYKLSWTAPSDVTVEGYKVIIKNSETDAEVQSINVTGTEYVVDTSDAAFAGINLEKLIFVVQSKIDGIYSGDSDVKTLMLAAPTIDDVVFYPLENTYQIKVSHPETVTYKYRLGSTEIFPNSRGRFVIPEGTITEGNIPAGFEVMAIAGVNESPYALYPFDFTYAGGNGTSENPYYIADYRHFKNIGVNLTGKKYFQQIADISLPADYAPFADGFNGTYNGDNYSITLNGNSASPNVATAKGYSIFGGTSSATLENIVTKGQLYATSSASHSYVAALIGYGTGTIRNCTNYASIECKKGNTVAAFAGRLTSGSITGCINYGEVKGISNVGGIAGWVACDITECKNYGDIIPSSNGAGIVAVVNTSTIRKSANIGNVTAGNIGSAIVCVNGADGTVEISESYNSGTIKAKSASAVYAYDSGKSTSLTIKNVFNTGSLIATDKTTSGLVLGYFNLATSKLNVTGFYDISESGLTVVGSKSNAGATVNFADAYVVNAGSITLPAGVTSISASALTTLPAGFSSDKWVIDTTAKYPYPTLKEFAYEGEVPEVTPDEPGEGGGETPEQPGEGGGENPGEQPGGGEEPTPPTPEVTEDGSEAKPYLIDTAEEFAAIFGSGASNSAYRAEGIYLKQTADFTLPSSYVNAGINAPEAINCVYDGNGKTITVNLTGSTSAKGTAVFGRVDAGGVIKNLTVKGTVTGTVDQVAGIIGNLNGGTISNCVNYADVAATGTARYVGGVVGYTNYGSSVIEYCYNYGSVSATGAGYCGGISGSLNGGTIRYCGNMGSITAEAGTDVAGITGMATGRTESNKNYILNCYNAGAITGSQRVGGIVGRTHFNNATELTTNVENCYNTGVITGPKTTGSIIGLPIEKQSVAGGKVTITVKNCYDIANPALQLLGFKMNDFTSDDGTYFNKIIVEKVYALNTTETQKFGSTITEADLKANPFGTDAWAAGSTATGKYAYPELKDNLYKGTVEDSGNGEGGSEGGDNNEGEGGEGEEPTPPVQTPVATINGVEFYTDGTTEETAFEISTAEAFTKVFGKTNTADASYVTGNYYFKQTGDFTLTADYIPTTNKFAGTYDGNGKVITWAVGAENDLKVFDGITGYGLFIIPTGTLKNITTAGAIWCGNETYVSAIAGGNGSKAKLTNCVNNASIYQTGATTGGLVARPAAGCTLTDCVNNGNITSTGANVGGMFGWASYGTVSAPITVTNCKNTGNLEGKSYVGGAFGSQQGVQIVDNFENTGTITATSSAAAAFVGSTGGVSDKLVIKNSKNSGEIKAPTVIAVVYANIGNYSNKNYYVNLTVENCSNTGKLTLVNPNSSASMASIARVADNGETGTQSTVTVDGYTDTVNIDVDLITGDLDGVTIK